MRREGNYVPLLLLLLLLPIHPSTAAAVASFFSPARRREGGLQDQFEREGEGAMQDRPQFARSARASS